MNEELLLDLFNSFNLGEKGSFDEFKADMADANIRKDFFTHYQLDKKGKYEEFEKELGFSQEPKKKEPVKDSKPVVGVSSPDALKKAGMAPEKIDLNKPINTISESTGSKPKIDTEIGGNPFELTDLKDQDPLQVGKAAIRNYDVRYSEGVKANKERTEFDLGTEALNNAYGKANSNIDKVRLRINSLKGKDDAFDEYMADLKAVSAAQEGDPDNNDPKATKITKDFFNEWGEVHEDEFVKKYLFPSFDFQNKIQGSRELLKEATPNHQKYLAETMKKQAEADKRNFASYGGSAKGAGDMLKRVIGGTWLGNIAAIGKQYSDAQVFYDLGEYAKTIEEMHPAASRHQRNTVEDYVHDDELGLDLVYDNSVNGKEPEFRYFVDPKTGNMVSPIMTEAIQDKINKYAKDKKFEDRRVPGAIVSQGMEELVEEVPELFLAVATDGLLSAGARALKGIKTTGTVGKIINKAKTIANAPIVKQLTPKHIGLQIGELTAGTIEGSADYREEALRAGLNEDEASAFQYAAGINQGVADWANPMEIAAMKGKRSLFFKNKLADYAAGKISKADLFKETGVATILNLGKNLGAETLSEGVLEPAIGNKIRKAFNELKGSDFKETDINPRNIEAGFWLSAISSGAFTIPTSIRISKGGLMADAIKYAVKNPDVMDAYFKGRRADQGGAAIDREDYLKSVLDQVKEAGLSEENQAKAAALMIDRQNASLEKEKLTEKYGPDAPLVRKKASELIDLELEMDRLFSGTSKKQEAQTAAPPTEADKGKASAEAASKEPAPPQPKPAEEKAAEGSVEAVTPKEPSKKEAASKEPTPPQPKPAEEGEMDASKKHKETIHSKFREEFSKKGIPADQIDATIALMETRAKVWAKEKPGRNPDDWYGRIADIKPGEIKSVAESNNPKAAIENIESKKEPDTDDDLRKELLENAKIDQPKSEQVGSVGRDVEAKRADIDRRKQALKDIMEATGEWMFINGVSDGTFAGEGLLNMNDNGDVILTRFADSEEGLTKGKGKTENLASIAGQFGGEQIATSGVEGGLASFSNGIIGEYHIPLNELISLIKEGYIVFAGLGNKEFVLSPHIADKYLSKINGKQINAKYDAEIEQLKNNKNAIQEQTTVETEQGVSADVESKKADIERRRQEDLETTKNIGEDKLKEGRENTKKIVESLKQRYPATSVQGIIIRILEKLIDFSKYSTIVDSEYINGRNASGQATWFGMMISQETLDGILAGKEHEVHTFIHEFIHGFTTSKISDYNIEKQGLIPGFKSKLTVKEKNAIEQLQRIFEKVKRDNPKSKEYGFTNLDEFIAEAFSNTSFQYTLKNTKAEGKKSNLFSQFINAIGDLLFEQLERWAKRFNKEIPDRSTITGILEDVLAWTEELIDQNNKLAYIATNEEINAYYDAELKALEQPTPTTQTERKSEQPTVLGKEEGSGVGEDVKSKLENEGFKPTLKPNGENEFILQVDDTKPNGKRSAGVIGLKTVEVGGNKFLSIGMTNVREGYEGKGLATNMYRYLMENLPEGYDGILSPKETRWNNEQIPKIHEKLSKEYDKTELANGDIIFKNKALEQSTSTTQTERKSEQTIRLEKEYDEAQKEVKAAKEKLATKRAKLEKTKQEDTEDLFGERKSNTPDKLFDERADANIEELLEQERADIKAAEKKANQVKKSLDDSKNQNDQTLFEAKKSEKKQATPNEGSKQNKSIQELEDEYNSQEVEELVALKKKLYPTPDIESPMSPEEKLLDRIIAKKFSDINNEILQKRKEKKDVQEAAKSDIDKAIDEIWKHFGQIGISSTPEQQAKDLELGIKLAGLYLKKGVYKLADIVRDGIEKLGLEKVSNILQYIKNGYLAYQAEATDEELEKMDDIKTVRNFTIQQIQNNEPDKKQPNDQGTGSKGSTNINRGKLDKPSTGNQPDLFSGIEEKGDALPDSSTESTGIREGSGRVLQTKPTSGGSRGISERGSIQLEPDYKPKEKSPGEIVTLGTPPQNFEIEENTLPKTFNAKSRFNDNLNALRVLRNILKEHRYATPEEQEVLVRYVGWGGLKVVLNSLGTKWNDTDEALRPQVEDLHRLIKELEDLGIKNILKSIQASTKSAYYTDIGLIKAIYSAIEQLGFTGGHILDPSAGIGHFTGAMPLKIRNNSKITQVEKDLLTGEILRQLYPKSSSHIQGLETAKLPTDYYDLIISNIPFGNFSVFDPTFKSPQLKQFTGRIHNYFFAKAIEQAKEGGLIAFVTSTGVMDAPQNAPLRQYIKNNTEFIGAIRLPSSAFEGNANTSVVSDIIFLKKTANPDNQIDFLESVPLNVPHKDTGETTRIKVNEYFIKNPDNAIGEFKAGGLYSDDDDKMTLVAPKGTDIKKSIEDIVKNTFPKNILTKQNTRPDLEIDQDASSEENKKATISEIYIDNDGKAYLKIDDYGNKTPIAKTHSLQKIKAFIKLRNALKKQYELESEGVASDVEIEENRKQLREAYNTFINKNGKLNQAKNKTLITKDINGYNILSLEKDGEKADIFNKRVINPKITINSAQNIEDAISISINEYGRVNVDRIASLLGQNPDTLVENNYGALFYDANGAAVSAEEYLSGNVKKKLSEAIELSKTNPIYEKNVEALRPVIPEDIPAIEIEVNVGARWIPTSYYEQFINQIFNARSSVTYAIQTDDFSVKGNPTVESENKYGIEYESNGRTKRVSGYELLQMAMENIVPVIKDKVSSDPDRYVVNVEQTAAAQEKQNNIKEEFKEWIWNDIDRRTELGRLYNDLFNTNVKRVHDGSKLTFEGLNNINLYPHQKDAIAMLINNNGGIIDHIVGAGKAQPLDAKILTPGGWVKMGDISVGDIVISIDGKPTKVTGVFPQGEKDIYKVIFSDGASTECCKEHLWLTSTYEERSYRSAEKKRGKEWNCSKPKVRSLEEISQTLLSEHLGAKNHSIPIVSEVHFSPQQIKVNPYLIGALIGDGGLTHQVIFSTADTEMIDLLSPRIPDNIKIIKKAGSKYDYALVMENKVKTGKRVQPNPLHKSLSEYGLCCRSEFKRIPSQYLFNTIETRIEVLRGLMDTDGYVEKSGICTLFSTSSSGLAEDVTFLVRSLGGTCSIRTKTPTYHHNGEKRTGLMAYIIAIKMPSHINPFRLKRKADLVVAKTKYQPVRYIVGVDYIGSKKAQCISVEHESHLYVTDDFIVTHNTMVEIVGSIKMKQIGTINRPAIIGLKSTIPDIVAEARSAYPSARILSPTESDFSPKNRKKFLSKIQNNDWDLIIMSHEQFGKIQQDPDTQIETINDELSMLEEELRELRSQGKEASKQVLKGLETRKENLLTKIAKLMAVPKDAEILNFKQLGIDHIMVDESHMFKNLEYSTRITRVAGLGDPSGSKRSFNMLTAARMLQKLHNGDKGVTFLSGTPISNSLVEMYLLFKYLRPNKMQELGYKTFDSWVAQFAEATSEIEYTVSADTKQKIRFRKFINLPELSMMYNEIADVRNDNNLVLPKPKIKGYIKDGELVRAPQLIAVEQSEAQRELSNKIIEFTRQKQGQRDGRLIGRRELTDSEQSAAMLLATMASSKLSVDMRLIDKNAEDNPTGKLSAVANNVAKIYRETQEQKGTQLIFSDLGTPKGENAVENLKLFLEDERQMGLDDSIAIFGEDPKKLPPIKVAKQKMMEVFEITEEEADSIIKESKDSEGQFNVYKELKRKLVENGVPPEQVVFIHDYDSTIQKKELFKKVNSGEIRIVIGSTQKLGTGTNVQKKIVALHHVDVPWTPAQMEQRNGRGIRQKNENKEVDIFIYGTERTLDAYKHQLLAAKNKFINQIKNGAGVDRTAKEGGGDDLTSLEIAAILSGNPLIMELAKADQLVNSLRISKKSFIADQQKNELLYSTTKARIPTLKEEIGKIEKDIETIKSAGVDKNGKQLIVFSVKDKTPFEKANEIGQYIIDKKAEALKKPLGTTISIGFVNGIELKVTTIRTESQNSIGLFSEIEPRLFLDGNNRYPVTSSSDPTAQGTALTNAINKVSDIVSLKKEDLNRHTLNLAKYTDLLKNQWPKQKELDEAIARQKSINAELSKEPEGANKEGGDILQEEGDNKVRENDLVYEPHDNDVFISVVKGRNTKTQSDVYIARINKQLDSNTYQKIVKPKINELDGEWNTSSKNILFYDRYSALEFKKFIEDRFEVNDDQKQVIKFQITGNGEPKDPIDTLEDGRIIITAFESEDLGSMLRKIAGVFEGDLNDTDKKIINNLGGSENFAKSFEKYLSDGKAPNQQLKSLFEKFKNWLIDVYKTLVGTPIEKDISPELKKIFDKLLTDQENANYDELGNPKNPIDPSLSQYKKADELRELSEENKPYFDEFLAEIDANIQSQSKSSFKTKQSIVEKANRPSIKAVFPTHDVEHIRDSFRGKTVLNSLDQLEYIFRSIFESPMEVVKLDVSKLFGPGIWGWRIISIDLRMPNGQIVEYYLPIQEVEQSKKDGNHAIFEKWRNRDINSLSKADLEEYKNDIELSNSQYQLAWEGFVARSGLSETALRAKFDQLLKSLPGDMASKLVYESSASGAPQAQSLPSKSKETKESPVPQVTQALPEEGSIDTELPIVIPANIQQDTHLPKASESVFKAEFNWFAPMGVELKQKENEKEVTKTENGSSQNSQSGGQDQQKKVRKIPKRYKKAQRKIRDPRYLAALKLEPGTARDLALRFFIRGNKITSAVVKAAFTKAGKEVNARIGLLNNELGFDTLDAAAHMIWSDQEGEMGAPDVFSFEEIANELEDVILEYAGTKGMVDEILSKYNAEPDTDAEYEYMKREVGADIDSESLDQAFDVYESIEEENPALIKEIADATDEEVERIVEEKMDEIEAKNKLTQEEIDSGDYDENGNFTRFQTPRNTVFEEASSAEAVHKTKCR